MTPTITMQDYPEPSDFTCTSFCLWTNSWPMGWPASPTDSVSSMLTLSGSSSPTLCHSQNGSDVSSTSLHAGLSKLEAPCLESTCPSSIDIISMAEANLDQAFARMLVSCSSSAKQHFSCPKFWQVTWAIQLLHSNPVCKRLIFGTKKVWWNF